MKHVIEYDCKCEDCNGSGLYSGMGEHDGFAVVCNSCKGTGKQHIKYAYEDFDGRKDKRGIKRVLLHNPGIGVGLGKSKGGVDRDGKELTLESFGGLTYKDWKDGKPFKTGTEMRAYTCPAWWYQGVDYKKKPEWNECISCGSFSECEQFKCKEKCWAKFDRQRK